MIMPRKKKTQPPDPMLSMKRQYLVYYSDWHSPGWFDVVHEFESVPEPKAIVKALVDEVPIHRVNERLKVIEIGKSWTGKELLELAGLEIRDYKVVDA